MRAIKLEQLNPEAVSQIEVTYLSGYSRITEYLPVLAIRYSGKYGEGAAGNGDAQYMYAKGEFGLALYEPMGVILDLSELDYAWGDMLELVFNVGERYYLNERFPLALVVGEKCAYAIGTLIHGHSLQPATSEDWIFDNFEDAWNYVEEKIEGQKLV